ncbi:CHAD domain-containing protein [Agromyces sp. SYSU K20354]|uniref:CHAD domain-containing protein n=1 Tax=Agromyces cavernae TaxID=2898659 RepID=UPI001E483A16|nr:CHAD domain-containing protein [Agromyces cavernae]MCD2441857.1 CHAD domain-containing protein [Agromyces cavernae]
MSGSDVAFDSAASAVVAALTALIARLDEAERAAIVDEPDAVHQARILVRRLRSVLRTFRPLFDRASVDDLRASLDELGDELGDVRDIEVRVEHAERHLADSVPAEAVPPGMYERLVHAERERYRIAHAELVGFLGGGGHGPRLLEFVTEPPFSARATRRAPKELARLLRREYRRVRKAAREGTDELESLHRLRRLARRLRYACEAVTEVPAAVFGDDVAGIASAAQSVQDVLGDHRDEVLFALQVQQAAEAAKDDGEPIDAYTTVADAAFADAARRLEDLPDASSALRRRAKVLKPLS